ncbi:Thymocyte selection-associated high mobility group box protein TOX [Varanus komodoensis]|nr:Thymocyte selection-associated high mobility group box protein TOX [Varanus komodoensis]
MQDLRNTEGAQYSSHPQIAAMRPRLQPGDMRQPGMMQHGQLTTINQSQLSAQLGLNMGGNNVPHNSPSPPGSKSATPSPSSSVHEDDGDETSKVNGGEKRPASDMGKKPKTPKKKKKKDPNEPQKPVSAYALFFRDTQAAIKGQNPNATFGEVSKIVASMWDGLGEEQKQGIHSKQAVDRNELIYPLFLEFTEKPVQTILCFHYYIDTTPFSCKEPKATYIILLLQSMLSSQQPARKVRLRSSDSPKVTA